MRQATKQAGTRSVGARPPGMRPAAVKASMLGMFILRAPPDEGGAGPVLARIDGELYAMVFSNAARALGAKASLGVTEALPFYICEANREQVVRELLDAGARGFIVDYDAASSSYVTAGAF